MPEPDSTAPKPFSAGERSSKNSRDSRNIHSRQSYGRINKPKQSPCARAKTKREQQLQRLGFKRTFDDLSRNDAVVRAVCNGY
ncbi:hypothetical protein [Thermomonas sp. HDW16]|uniref:hypothetical protein n=1 Tax=Thermomonas sp. HDW16 TaxID=2714945 RepID=UPI00140C361C|nr:hypothetical protein [Thermomonas sp. HDW16]QIL20628.1 hypothetical protein G7079_07700 [Thermomonas sp. HDW16]